MRHASAKTIAFFVFLMYYKYLQEKTLMNYLYIVIGGGIGALFRYFSTQFINSSINIKFPLGTLFVNCIGALIIGFYENNLQGVSFRYRKC
jgi:fluoride ion exporter CrcB/FEX